MKELLVLTKKDGMSVLIGVKNIIDAERHPKENFTIVRSVGAMITTHYVRETPEEIYQQYIQAEFNH